MITALSCLPCLIRQALDATVILETEPQKRERVLKETFLELSRTDLSLPPPEIAAFINRLVRERSGISDPYKEIKREQNRIAENVLPELRQKILDSDNPLLLASRLAIAGNIIDSGVKSHVSQKEIMAQIDHALQATFHCPNPGFENAVKQATSILYLTDNAGEIFFDRLLIEQLPKDKTTVAVRGNPVLNDATREDAVAAGIDTLVKLIDNGTDIPGTVPEECTEQFRAHYHAADLIISKGQGNYECLNERSENIWFLFMAKCDTVANQIGVAPNTHVLINSQNFRPAP